MQEQYGAFENGSIERRRVNPDAFTPVYGAREVDYENSTSGLPGRNALYEVVDHAILEHAGKFSLVAADLDNLKEVNDTEGHLQGDRYISNAARALDELTRRTDALAMHVSGDELWIIFPGITDKDELSGIIERLQTELDELGIPCSMGGLAHTPGKTSEELRKEADELLEVDKKLRKYYGHTHEQREAAKLIGMIASQHGLNPRSVPGLLDGIAHVEGGLTEE